MRVFDKLKKKELLNYDLEKGYLMNDRLFIKHHEAVQAVEEKGHYETIKEYPNGGKDVKWVIDIPAVQEREAYDEYEDIQVYVPYTEKELTEHRILELKGYLYDTDYQAIKYAEGMISDYDYSAMREQRQTWRDEINELEKILELLSP